MENNGKSIDAKRLFENQRLLITYQELSERIQIPVQTLTKWVYAETIPHYKLGRSVRFEAEEVVGWLAKNKRGKKNVS